MSLADIQEWLNDQGQPTGIDEETCAAAAAAGRVDILMILRSQQPPCHWDARACTAAAFHGHLEVLQWIRQQQPPAPYGVSTTDAAAAQGHVDVLRWLLSQEPPCPSAPKPRKLHLNTLKAMSDWFTLPECEHIFVRAACHAARRKDQEVLDWLTSLHPALTLGIVRQLLLRKWAFGVSLMQTRGCLDFEFDHYQEALWDLLIWPARMGDVGSVQILKDVLIANELILASACAACEGRIACKTPDDKKIENEQLQYWESCSGRANFLAVAEWLMGLDEAGPDLLSCVHQALERPEDALLLVEMQANRPESQPTIFWSAATHSFAAAHTDLSVLRWLLRQQGLAPDFTTVHPDCSSARMLLLVHGHGWQVPAALAERFGAVEKRLLALIWAARQDHQKAGNAACLGRLPPELIKKIACIAGIDFSWSLSDRV